MNLSELNSSSDSNFYTAFEDPFSEKQDPSECYNRSKPVDMESFKKRITALNEKLELIVSLTFSEEEPFIKKKRHFRGDLLRK